MPLLPLLVLLLCWLQLFSQLWAVWASRDQYAYGWFVPFLAAALLWRRWLDRPAPDHRSLITGHWSLVIALLTIFLLALLLPFRLLETANPAWFVLRWIHALTLMSISLCALRFWGGVSGLRHYWFPLFFLLTCLPWPSRIDVAVTQGLMHGVARVTVDVVGWLNIPAVQQRSVLEIATGAVGIDEACSGIRSLQTSIMLALLLGEVFRLRLRQRVVLMISGILVALVANVGRTSFLTWSAASQGFEKMHHWHGPAGLAIVGVVMGSLLLLAWFWRDKAGQASRSPTSDFRPPPPVDAQPASLNAQRSTRFALILCCLWIPVTEGMNWAWYHWPGKGLVAAAPWSLRWPTNAANFEETPLPQRTVDILHCTQHRTASWTDSRGNAWSLIFLHWSPAQGADAYVGGHNPEQCMSGNGRTFLRRVAPVAVEIGSFSIQFKHLIFDQEKVPLHVFQGTWEPSVPPSGQRLFGATSPQARICNALERRIIHGGTTLEFTLTGPTSNEEAANALESLLQRLIVPGSSEITGGL